MSAPHFMEILLIDVKIFHFEQEMSKPHGGAESKLRESPKSLKYPIWRIQIYTWYISVCEDTVLTYLTFTITIMCSCAILILTQTI